MALAIPACGFVHDEHIDGPYRLIAVDVTDQMSVCYQLKDACVGRIPQTVFAVGHNPSYFVAARHPASNREIIEYFYLARSLDGPLPVFDREITSLKIASRPILTVKLAAKQPSARSS